MSDPHTRVGAAVAGSRNELLGHVSALYFDNATGRPAWAAVQGGECTAVIPLELSRFDGATLHVPFGMGHLRDAPHHDPSTQISTQDGEDLYRHYGLIPTSASHPPGPRLSNGCGPADLAAEDGVLVRSEERLCVGTENVVVGRARLVTHIVTEDETFTIPVSRQEIRLVIDRLPEHEQTVTDTAPAEQAYELILHAEQVLFTKQVVPVERVRIRKRVVTAEQAVDDQVRVERIDLEHLDAAPPRTDAPRGTPQPAAGEI